ncbi:MAG: radical SAM protein [Sulfolobales archaeon]|nr:radical SAM protein [Sulfolobales archaeon]
MAGSVAKLHRVIVDKDRCSNCGFCRFVSTCYSPGECVGCLACYWACPHSARVVVEDRAPASFVKIVVDGNDLVVPSGVTVARALEISGFTFSKPGAKGISTPCGVGGCWSCAVLIDGSLERACVTPVKSGMIVSTKVEDLEPLRVVHGPEPHLVGGKATPWWEVDYSRYVEAAIWVAGCNLRCPQCQNYGVTYDNTTSPITPSRAARLIARCHREYLTRGVAISGGEPTINRRWLVEFFSELSKLVKPKVRKHLDSNGTILTPDYVDELVEAGCNNIGIEPKCARVSSYMKITGISDPDLASQYLETAWRAAEYVWEHYSDRMYLGIGLVYNADLVSLEEVAEAGERIASIDRRIQVTVLDYFPAFKRRSIKRPTVREMLMVKKMLEDVGLETVVVQTSRGHIGPGNRNLSLAKQP